MTRVFFYTTKKRDKKNLLPKFKKRAIDPPNVACFSFKFKFCFTGLK